jgi:cytochrome b561
VLAFVLIAAGAMIARTYAEAPAERTLWLTIHQSAGIFVLGLTLIRLVWRWWARVGEGHDALPLAIRIGATIGHTSLYVVLLALTVVGWLTSNAFGRPLIFLGVVPLPALMGRDRSLGDDMQAWHGDFAWLLLILVLVHVGAALWHHFLCGDGVLRSMAPFRRRTRAGTASRRNDTGASPQASRHTHPTNP